jgi:hypothetical protein
MAYAIRSAQESSGMPIQAYCTAIFSISSSPPNRQKLAGNTECAVPTFQSAPSHSIESVIFAECVSRGLNAFPWAPRSDQKSLARNKRCCACRKNAQRRFPQRELSQLAQFTLWNCCFHNEVTLCSSRGQRASERTLWQISATGRRLFPPCGINFAFHFVSQVLLEHPRKMLPHCCCNIQLISRGTRARKKHSFV